MTAVDSDHVRVSRDGGVATVVIDRPDRLNAYTPAMAAAVRETVEDLAADDATRAVVLTGAGPRAFSAGMDVQAYTAEGDEPGAGSVETLLESTHNTHDLVKTLRSVEVPVVAAVNGHATGGGMDVALACDFRIVRADATFVQAYVNVGLVPDAGAYLLPRLVGEATAKELIMTGDPIEGERAADLGLARTAIEGSAADVRETATEFAASLAEGPTVAIGTAKSLVNESFEVSIETALAHAIDGERTCHETADHREGVAAFLEDREPDFAGE
ncbi:MAG: enoyl-CoA hydratase/isomerase family protein [Halanaeroarchaeum sp.]